MALLRTRPSRGLSTVIGIAMIGLAIGMFTWGDEQIQIPIFFPLVVVGMGLYHLFNAITGEGYMEETRIEGALSTMVNSEGKSRDEQFRELECLREKDLISVEEFDRKREEIFNPPAAETSGSSVESRLRTLQKLKSDDLISSEEFDTKRAEILSEL